MRRITRVLINTSITLVAFSTMASAACYQNITPCPVGPVATGPSFDIFPPTGGCAKMWLVNWCTGGPNSAVNDPTKKDGYEKLGDECGTYDRLTYEEAGFVLTNPLTGTRYCVDNPFSAPVVVFVVPAFGFCGDKVGINFGPCKPAL